jgi:hypothetical protein
MSLGFTVLDIFHNIVARFIHSSLPNAKKPYNLKAEFQPELNIHGVASKAEVYNINIDPKVIEDGVNAFMELVYYLVADGYRIKTPLFNLRMRLPGEYSGDETRLAEGVYPEARLQTAAAFRKYLKEKVKIEFAGIAEDLGHIGEALDAASGDLDESATMGNILEIRGHGLKLDADDAHKDEVGVYFEASDGVKVKCKLVPVNEPRLIKVIVPTSLTADTDYSLVLITQSTIHGSSHILKNLRTIRSEFTIKALSAQP